MTGFVPSHGPVFGDRARHSKVEHSMGAITADEPGHLQQRDFQRLARYISEYSGIKMPLAKKVMVEGRLRRRLRETGHVDFASYCRFLFENNGLATEGTHLIDAVTTNKTEFFREPAHFEFLINHILPEHLETRARTGAPLNIWSAAASSGAEAYTVAMLLSEQKRAGAHFRHFILGTDISREILQAAVDGIYPDSMLTQVPAAFQARYFRRGKGRAAGQVRVVPELRAQVHFAWLNLMQSSYPVARDMDVVFCRNILIYFDRPTQAAVLERLCQHIRPGGYLILGHSESLAGHDLPVEQVVSTVFRRR